MPRARRTHTDKSLVGANRRNAARAAELTERALNRVEQLMDEGDDKAAAFAARAGQHIALTNAISTDKALLLEGRPTQIVRAERDVDDIVRALDAAVPGLIIDGTATELPVPGLPPAA